MFGWIEICLLSIAAILLLLRWLPSLRLYRSLLGGGSALMLITALFPRPGNPLGQFLFGTAGSGARLPVELFGILWWILGAWLSKSMLDLVLSRTFFPENDEPHARRLFADLASGLIYVLAVVGIVGTVFKEPVSTFLATSGVVAIVLGLALQNTLGDVLSGLAINIAAVAPSRVIDALKGVADVSAVIAHGTLPQAYACGFSDSLVRYELAFAIDSFALSPAAKSDMLGGIVDAFLGLDIHIGTLVLDGGNTRPGDPAAVTSAPLGSGT